MRHTSCDGPGCEVTDRGETTHYHLGADYTFIVVEANEDADHGQFHSWSCLAAWATQRAMERESAFDPGAVS